MIKSSSLVEKEEEILMKFIELLFINGFCVDYEGDGKFKVWVRGFDPEYAYVNFQVNFMELSVKILDAGGEYRKIKTVKKYKEFFTKSIISLMEQAIKMYLEES